MEVNMQILCTASRKFLLSLGTTVIYFKGRTFLLCHVNGTCWSQNCKPISTLDLFCHTHFLRKRGLWYYWQSWWGTRWAVFLSTCTTFLQPRRWRLLVSPSGNMSAYGPTRCHSAGDIIKTAPGAKARRRLNISFLSSLYSKEILEVKGKPRLPVHSSILCDLDSVTQPFVEFSWNSIFVSTSFKSNENFMKLVLVTVILYLRA